MQHSTRNSWRDLKEPKHLEGTLFRQSIKSVNRTEFRWPYFHICNHIYPNTGKAADNSQSDEQLHILIEFSLLQEVFVLKRLKKLCCSFLGNQGFLYENNVFRTIKHHIQVFYSAQY